MSPAAREADAKLSEIAHNPSLTGADKQAQIQQVVACKLFRFL